LIYTVSGKIHCGIDKGKHFNFLLIYIYNIVGKPQDISFTGNYINLDGSPYSYMKFAFENKISEEAFKNFFSISSTDGGYSSFEIKDFSFITTNRDLDMKQWDNFLQDDDIDLQIEGGIIAKKGIKIKLGTTLVEDCEDYTLCRLFKENLIFSKFEFEGFLTSTQTFLTSAIDDFSLQENVHFTNSELIFTMENSNKNILVTTIEGLMIAQPEDERNLTLESTWKFGNNPKANIEIFSNSYGIYDDIFGLNVLGMTDINSVATIYNEGYLSDFSLKGLGIFGYNCYANENLYASLVTQETEDQESITDLGKQDVNENGEISILNPS